MQFTQRYWAAVGVVVLLGLWALFLQRPLPLLGAATVGSWLLTRQYRFVRTAQETVSSLSVTQRLDQQRAVADETVPVTVRVRAETPVTAPVRVVASLPLASDETAVTCHLSPGETTAEAAFDVSWPAAGEFTLPESRVTVTDQLHLFDQSRKMGTTPSVTVEPRTPQDIHIGKGGDRTEAGIGGYESGRAGISLTPVEVREYVPGDNTRRIDWKATARYDETYVREFEGELDTETIIIFDHRAAMAAGEDGKTKLDFAREVALGIVDNAETLADPLGWYSVGDGGLTRSWQPSTAPDAYQLIAEHLRELQPTDSQTGSDESLPPAPGHVRQLAGRLDGESNFDRKLRPFFAGEREYVEQFTERPLFRAVGAAIANRDRGVRTVIITDDTYQAELREAVKLLRGNSGRVIVFLTPSVLYQADSITDLERTYSQYTAFKSFRRTLDALRGVSAYEVGPGDRLAAVLSAGTRQREVPQ